MKTLHFSTTINASPQKVWDILWNDTTYRQWTHVFSEGSHAVSDWNEGSSILFLGPSGDGMYAEIEKKQPHEFMSFKHLGVAKEGKLQPLDEETKKWSGAHENYTLKSVDGATQLTVDIDMMEDYEDYFSTAFPNALEVVKQLSEA